MSDIGLPSLPDAAMPSSPALTPPPEAVVTQDDRTMAVLAHALQVAGWFIAPLVILIVRRDSRFVAFHALQALLLQVVYILFWLVVMVAWFGVIFGTIARGGGAPSTAAPPPMIFAFFPLVWLGGMAFWVLVIVAAVVYSIKAGRGEWAGYPILGGLARRILNL